MVKNGVCYAIASKRYVGVLDPTKNVKKIQTESLGPWLQKSSQVLSVLMLVNKLIYDRNLDLSKRCGEHETNSNGILNEEFFMSKWVGSTLLGDQPCYLWVRAGVWRME